VTKTRTPAGGRTEPGLKADSFAGNRPRINPDGDRRLPDTRIQHRPKKRSERELDQMTDEQRRPPDLAALLAERFFELLREKGSAVGVTRFFTFQPWRDLPGETRQVLTDVFAQLQRDAIEQRQEWTRAALEAEVDRMREEIRNPTVRLLRVKELPGFRERVFLSEPAEAPPLSEILRPEDWPTVPGSPVEEKFRCRACGVTWRKSELKKDPRAPGFPVCGDLTCQGSCDRVREGSAEG
jgi:hypothetical protein